MSGLNVVSTTSYGRVAPVLCVLLGAGIAVSSVAFPAGSREWSMGIEMGLWAALLAVMTLKGIPGKEQTARLRGLNALILVSVLVVGGFLALLGYYPPRG